MHDNIVRRIFTPQVYGTFTLADTIKMAEGVCDSLIVKWIVTVLPVYKMEREPVYIPIGKTSIIWERDNLEHMGGDVVTDSMVSMYGCDSVEVYYFIKETPSGYCGADSDGKNLSWYISEDSVLHIEGQGAMADFYESTPDVSITPWYDYRYAIKEIDFPEALTSIGSYAFYDCYNLLSVSIPSAVISVGQRAFEKCWALNKVNTPSLEAWCNIHFADTASNPTCRSHELDVNGAHIQHLVLPQTVTAILRYAFYGCDFKKATLHANVTSIGVLAFEQCTQMDTMVCHAMTPPELEHGFPGNLYTTYLCVPQAAMGDYIVASGYASHFKDIIGFSNVKDTTATTATITWVPEPDVVQYTVSIYLQDALYAQYIVDGNGQVTDTVVQPSALIAKMRKKKLDSSETFTISIGGLKPSTNYSYDVTGYNAASEAVYQETGYFTTRPKDEEGIDQISNDQSPMTNKVIEDGRLLILRGDKVFTIIGQEQKTHLWYNCLRHSY